MKLIIDTHIFLWVLASPSKISKKKRDIIQTMSNIVYLSSISVAEIAIKTSIGKLDCNFDIVKMAEKSGFELLDFTSEDAVLLKDMPFHHKDPFDRMLIAQSIANDYAIITDDSKFQFYDCKLV